MKNKMNISTTVRIGRSLQVQIYSQGKSIPITIPSYSYNPNKKKRWKHSCIVMNAQQQQQPFITKEGNCLRGSNNQDVLTNIPHNVVATPSMNASLFLGATFDQSSCRHLFTLGTLEPSKLLSLFRFKIWWMIPRVGNSGRDIPIETQMLLLHHDSTSYVLFLPLLDGAFRCSLQGSSTDELQLTLLFLHPILYILFLSILETTPFFSWRNQSSNSLFAFILFIYIQLQANWIPVVCSMCRMMEKHLGTFSPRETKKMPGMLDWFGWCTWDAFYHQVNPQGIKDGLKSLSDGGTPPRFLIIDDGWQDTSNEFQKEGEPLIEGSQFGGRLMSIKENNKFRKKTNEAHKEEASDFKDFIADIRRTFALKYVYVWHALMGYWGGVHPDAPEMKKYNSTLRYPVQSPGNLAHMRDISMDCMEKYGVGTIDPAKISEFYNDLHSYLVSQNVDGVKVDVQNILETVARGMGGRVSLTRHFQKALEKSIAANFQDNGIICCMGQSIDSLYHSKRSAVTRASDDYWPADPKTQTLHIAAVAFNSIFLGEIVVPDWDMFYSQHYAAEFHAAARAVGGCGIYVSDKPGRHNFKLLKRLVLPDGSVLRARYPGRPSRDCLFIDPVMDGKSLLKIWNLNKHSGVLGIFNCQGAGSWPGLQDNEIQDNSSRHELYGQLSPDDVEYLEEVTGDSWTGDFAVFSFNTGRVCRLPKKGCFNVSLKVLECDVFTISPIKIYDEDVEFAAIGLVEMYNGGGAVEAMNWWEDKRIMNISGRGCGRFGAYSTRKPKHCVVNKVEQEFEFRGEDNLLTLIVPAGINSWNISIQF